MKEKRHCRDLLDRSTRPSLFRQNPTRSNAYAHPRYAHHPTPRPARIDGENTELMNTQECGTGLEEIFPLAAEEKAGQQLIRSLIGSHRWPEIHRRLATRYL